MLVLAIDTCESRGSVSLLGSNEVLSSSVHSGSEEYSSWLLPAVDRTLAEAARAMEDVDLYAVASGPGSFTGVRIGLTTVKAWAEVFGKPIVATSRLEVLAAQAPVSIEYVASFINAQREQMFAALYKREGGDLVLIEEEMVTSPENFIGWVVEETGGSRVAWVSTDPMLVTERPAWRDRAARGGKVLSLPCALAPMIGKLGIQKASKGQVVDGLTLDANYVRRSYVEVFPKGLQVPGDSSVRSEMRVSIRNYSPLDAPAVIAIGQRCPEAAEWSAAGYDQAFSAGEMVLLADVEGQVSGFLVARVLDKEAEILNLAVDPPQRRKRVGTRLLTAALADAKLKDVERVYLEVRESNQVAIAFYERRGFFKNGERRQYYRQPTENAVLMEKKITG